MRTRCHTGSQVFIGPTGQPSGKVNKFTDPSQRIQRGALSTVRVLSLIQPLGNITGGALPYTSGVNMLHQCVSSIIICAPHRPSWVNQFSHTTHAITQYTCHSTGRINNPVQVPYLVKFAGGAGTVWRNNSRHIPCLVIFKTIYGTSGVRHCRDFSRLCIRVTGSGPCRVGQQNRA